MLLSLPCRPVLRGWFIPGKMPLVQRAARQPSQTQTYRTAALGSQTLMAQHQRSAAVAGVREPGRSAGRSSGLAGGCSRSRPLRWRQHPGPATPAAVHSASPTAQGHILHQPYSHFVWCSSQQFSESRPLGFASALCTDIEEMQSVQGTCPVHLYMITHSADWDTARVCTAATCHAARAGTAAVGGTGVKPCSRQNYRDTWAF
jgi:hypothetical protein